MTDSEAIRDLDIIRFNPHWDELVNEEYWQELMEMAIKALEEVQQYRAIGTPEECRAAVEKQTAKRALHQGCYDKNGEWHEWNGINGKPYELCPNCRAMDDAIEIVKSGGNADLLMDRAKSKSGERIPYDSKWK